MFVYLTRVAEPWVAIVGGVSASGAVVALTRRNGLVGALTLFGFSIVVVAGAVGIVQGSEQAYLTAGPISDFLFVPLYAGSIVRGRPLVGGISRELVPAIAGRLPADAPVYHQLSVAWALFDLAHGGVAVVLRAGYRWRSTWSGAGSYFGRSPAPSSSSPPALFGARGGG